MKICIHKAPDYCMCNLSGDTPNENCPIHGVLWPPKCMYCGQFMTWKQRKENDEIL